MSRIIRLDKRLHGVTDNCLSVTSSDYLTFLGTMPAGCYVKTYEWAESNPRPSLDIANNKILFLASGKIYNIMIYNSSNIPLYFLYCCEGSGNDSLNRTVHNGLANNYTDHFLISSTGKWSRCQRDDVYRFGYSTKTNLSLLSEKVTNGTFGTDISGWSACPEGILARSTVIYPSGGIKITRSLYNNNNSTGAYQSFSNYRIFRYYFSSKVQHNTGDSGRGAGYTIGRNNYGYIYFPTVQYNNIDFFTYFESASSSVTTLTLNTYLLGTTTYITLWNIMSQGYEYNYDDVTCKVYEDNVKIPTLLTNRTKDCFGNTKTN